MWALVWGGCMHAKSLQSCLILCDPMNHSLPGSSVHVILKNTGVGSQVLLQGLFLMTSPSAPPLQVDLLLLSHQGSPKEWMLSYNASANSVTYLFLILMASCKPPQQITLTESWLPNSQQRMTVCLKELPTGWDSGFLPSQVTEIIYKCLKDQG